MEAMTTFTFVKSGTQEWDYMWDALAKHPSNRRLPEPTVAEHLEEVWQYMETVEVSAKFTARWYLNPLRWFRRKPRYIHCFRHRAHPTHGIYFRLGVAASQQFCSEQN
ncbi:hypothetical protein RNF85_000392 [Salmonella enterica]|nr:hypothetical protein [Salmonella enterica]